MAVSYNTPAYKDVVGNIVKNPVVSSTTGKLLGYQDYVTGEQIIASAGSTIDDLTPIPTGQIGEALKGAATNSKNAANEVLQGLPNVGNAKAAAQEFAAKLPTSIPGADNLGNVGNIGALPEVAGRLPLNTNAIDPLKNQLSEAAGTLQGAAGNIAANLPKASLPTDALNLDPLNTEFTTLEEADDVLSGAEFETFQGDKEVSADTGETETAGILDANGEPTGAGDGEAPQVSTGATPLPSAFLSEIIPRENPLDRFATYNYSISLYLVNKPGLEQLQKGNKTVQGLPLLVQSGGAKQNEPDLFGAKRSPFFSLDYYIDDVEMEGVVSGASTQGIHNQHTIKFTITEPYGLSFIDNLHKATKHYNESLGKVDGPSNYASQMFLMVIRFNGYDIEGKAVNLAEISDIEQQFTEKYIPFVFTGISFTYENDKIVYRCEAAAPMSFYPTAMSHSAVPFNIELKGGTLGEILGDANSDLYTANANIDDTRTESNAINDKTRTTVSRGLAQALTAESEKVYGAEYANHYKIIFEEGSEIEKKRVVTSTSAVDKETAATDADKKPKKPNADRVDKQSKNITIQAGTSILKAIETIVRNSEYIKGQQILEIDEATGKPRYKQGETPVDPLQWFKVVMQVNYRTDTVNPRTNDYAYDIVYKIKRYLIGNHGSVYFPPPIYRGVHKRYPNWFTGENTQILNFRQDFNYLYFQQFSTGATETDSAGAAFPIYDTVHVTRRYYQPNSAENTQGSKNRSGEPAASVASMLYSPGDTAISELEIVGDPDWIIQSELFYGVDKTHNSPFDEDGSVNVNGSEIYYSLEYNIPADYDLETGLLTPQGHQQYKGERAMNIAYRANTIVSRFKQGAFTQTLTGSLMQWQDNEYVTRVDGGFVYDRSKRAANLRQSQVARLYGTKPGSQQSKMLAEQDDWFTQDEIEAWQSGGAVEYEDDSQSTIGGDDIAFNQGPINGQTTVGGDDIAFNQGEFANNTVTGDDIAFNQGEFANNTVTGDDVAFNQGPLRDSTQPPLSNVAQAPVETPVSTDPASPREESAPSTPAPTLEVTAPVTTQTNPTAATVPEPAAEVPVGQTTQVTPRSLGTGETDITIPSGGQIDTVYNNPTAFHDKGAVVGSYNGIPVEANTQGAMDAQVNAINTGKPVEYTDVVNGETQKWYYDPSTGDQEFIGSLNPDTGKFE